ncbi:cell division protein FtsZ [Salinibaculum rarum]|uniref:cell division protein FtsZ n=1 Tax=Salinibaculum rarum TaxID=3058903 RepID=UPI00265E3621|nr:cell division protein FtsZ [Salinibaculum sp. KK48]
MQNIVNTAIENHQKEETLREENDSNNADDFGDPNIVIVGAGGAGNNTVNRLYNMGIGDAETIALNTDKQHLQMIKADTKILVGKSLTNGLGAGGDPEMGERATKNAQDTIKEVLGDPDLVFVTAGMGGGTGTGASPVIAEIASDMGAIVVGMVSTPFDVERARRKNAEEGLHNLRQHADSVIVLDNNHLLDYVPNLPISKAFSVMDQIISETVKGISETITQPSLINLDYADMANTMNNSGVAVMLLGETKDKNKVQEVVQDATQHPLLDVNYQNATGGLIHITGGPNLSLKEAEGIADNLTTQLDSHADVIWGARINEEYRDKVRVMAIMTGVKSPQILGEDSHGLGATGSHNTESQEVDTVSQPEVNGQSYGESQTWHDGGKPDNAAEPTTRATEEKPTGQSSSVEVSDDLKSPPSRKQGLLSQFVSLVN